MKFYNPWKFERKSQFNDLKEQNFLIILYIDKKNDYIYHIHFYEEKKIMEFDLVLCIKKGNLYGN